MYNQFQNQRSSAPIMLVGLLNIEKGFIWVFNFCKYNYMMSPRLLLMCYDTRVKNCLYSLSPVSSFIT
ncbi:MAG: hypothetical protein JWQ09_2440 [Segetibacter sp.]|nr:hypothetical protein [Segetibacter sp.]